ncbi:hypothetical protein GG804_25195 [Sphingomonas histidinilytica]|uniref:hypothetical protein n=1 Tax=Rhizorhabdus histidinilytica TaxID=439228 RepID=UPI001ADCACA7|nr:hypothetical protein [Rhizorhabdus histidinilytica]MBO9380069.1 hypothetical protein [Rhizorhabdus histidinilytica]
MMVDLRGRVTRLEGGLVALGLMMLLAIGGLYLYLGNRLTPIEAKVSALEVDVAKIGGDIKLVDYRLARMEQRLDGIDQKLDAALSRNAAKR